MSVSEELSLDKLVAARVREHRAYIRMNGMAPQKKIEFYRTKVSK